MSDEADREALRRAWAGAIGEEHAAELLERIPPVTWGGLARQRDLLALRSDLETVTTDVAGLGTASTSLEEHLELEMDVLRFEVVGRFRRQMVEQNRLLCFSMLGAIFTTAALAFVAATF